MVAKATQNRDGTGWKRELKALYIGDSGAAGLHKQEKWCFESGIGKRMNASSICGIGNLGE